MCRIVSDVDILEVKVAERALNLEAIPANSIAMGAARNERHIMPRRCHSPAEISSHGPCCHNRNSHMTTSPYFSRQGCRFVIVHSERDVPVSASPRQSQSSSNVRAPRRSRRPLLAGLQELCRHQYGQGASRTNPGRRLIPRGVRPCLRACASVRRARTSRAPHARVRDRHAGRCGSDHAHCLTPWRATRAGRRSVGADDEQRLVLSLSEVAARCVKPPLASLSRTASEHRNLSWSLR
jgi:hypothetical protein